MIHYSCDVCGRMVSKPDEHYKVFIYIESAGLYDPETEGGEPLDGGDLPGDDFSAPEPPEFDEDFEEHRLIFDLCSHCKEQYLKDPFFRKIVALKHEIGHGRN